MKKPQYEYVASGINYGIYHTNADDPTEIYKRINSWLGLLNNTNNHYISGLFNAFTEAGDGKIYKEHFPAFNSLMGDSGGLQMVSLGIGTISDEKKSGIYDIQGKYATTAMIFDEIPVTTPNAVFAGTKDAGVKRTKTELKDTSSRFFDPTKFEWSAKETARNMINQINHFDKLETDTKVVCVLQGNSTEDYQRWLDIILKEVPASKHEKINGIAFGSPAFGAGLLEDIEKYFFISQIQAPDHLLHHFHLLGVGALRRLYPVAVFRNSGIVPADVLISYDSTKHTGGLVRGDLQINEDCLRARRDTQQNLNQQSNEITSFARDILKDPIQDVKWLHDTIIHPKKHIIEMYGDGPANYSTSLRLTETKFLILLCSIYNFIKTFDKCHSDATFMSTVCPPAIIALQHVQTEKEFAAWKQHAKTSVRSNKVQILNTNNLSEFFA